MSNQDCSTEDKVYRFISDPKHKENLSGRVRAACITCRRKKIKCSGDVPCSTCKEKGIVCEGLKERKRPKTKTDNRRGSDDATQVTQDTPVASTSTRMASAESSHRRKSAIGVPSRGSTSATSPQRPVLKKTNTMNSDSGYSSGKPSHRHESKFGDRLPFETIESTMATYDSSTDISPTNIGPHDWSSLDRQNSRNYGDPARSNSDDVVSAGCSTIPVNWTDQGSHNAGWWLGNTSGTPDATNLISAARALEEQAQSLRRLAVSQDASIADEHRRQTITLPVSLDTPDALAYPLAAFDDMSLLFTGRTSGSGFTPAASEFNSWLDVHSDYSTVPSFSHATHSHDQPMRFTGTQVLEPEETAWHQTLSLNLQSDAGPPSARSHEHPRSERSRLEYD